MAQGRRQLALLATQEALRVRQRAGHGLHGAICVYDLCERMDVSVRFSDIPSMEGIYLPDARPKPAIVVSSLRPAGRQAMTCGHEFGHHLFGHGEQFDELIEDRTDQRRNANEEYLADLFAAMLLMPKLAVSRAFATRSLDPRTCRPESVYGIASWFGVGYGTLITHMARTLNMIDATRERDLSRHQPKDIRASLLGQPCPHNLHIADTSWVDRAIDIQTGELLLLPPDTTLEGQAATVIERSDMRLVARAETPGIARAFRNRDDWAAFIRVSRLNYVGRAQFRFEPEVGDGG